VLAARWAYLAKQGVLTDEPSRAFTAACAAVWLHATASDSIVRADPPGDPSIAATAQSIASLRVMMER
jgi:NAD(P)H-hydrate repair Nnr-like enzyme with NAD(P)H-hydrate dehydratase domain